MSHNSLFLSKRLTSSVLALFLLGSASLAMLSGCGESLPPKASSKSTPSPSTDANAPVSPNPETTGQVPTTAPGTPSQDMPSSTDESPTPSTNHEDNKSPKPPVLDAKQLVEQDIIMLASTGVDPFSIAMHVNPIEVKKDDVEALSPYYQALVGISPLVTVKVVKVEKPTVDPITGTYPGLPAPVVVDPTIAMQDALSTINVNGISFKKTSPMAILALSGKDQAGTTTLFVKKGSRLFVNGYSVLVEDITTNTVRVSTAQGRARVSQTLMIQDIFGFSRSGTTGTSSPSSGGISPSSPTGSSKDVSSQDIDKIVKDLLN
ncbi:MAG: hypothetical protein ACK551_06145 [Vampirovibrionales bacterium]